MMERLNETNWRTWLLIVAGLVVVLGAGFAAAATFYGTSSGLVEHDAPNGPTILSEDVDYGDNVPIRDGVVDFNHTRFESSGETYAEVSGFDSEFLTLDNLDASDQLNVYSDSRPTIRLTGSADSVAVRDYAVDDGLADLSVTNANNLVVNLTSLPSESWIVLTSDSAQDVAAWTGNSNEAQFDIPDGATADYEIEEVTDSVVSNPSPHAKTVNKTSDIELSVDIDAPDGGQYDIAFVNADTDQTIGVDTVTDSGTASVTWSDPPLGTNNWYVVVGDTMQSETFEFQTPATVEIRDELTQELLNESLEVEVSFFGDPGETILTRTTSDGIVDLSGLDPDQAYVISASPVNDSSNYIDRRVYLPDITEQATVYLLNESQTDSVEIEFILEDQTGEFDAEGTYLIVSKAFETGSAGENTTVEEYRQISGDLFGAASGYSVVLEEGIRYKLTLENDDGKRRELGHYQPERSEAITLDVGELSWNLPREVQEDVQWDFERFEQGGREIIRVQINDSEQELDDVHVQIYETDNQSNVIYDEVHPGPYGELTITQTIPSQYENVTSWTIDWVADKNSTVGGQTILGTGSYGIGLPVESGILAIFSGLLLTFISGFFSVRVSELGMIIMPLCALGLFAMGWLPLPLSWILGALALGIMVEFASRGGFKQR